MTAIAITFARANAAFYTAQAEYLTAAECYANHPTPAQDKAAYAAYQRLQAADAAAKRAAQAMHNEAYAIANA